MLTKRRIIVATIVFVFAGLLLYTFANPSEVKEGTTPVENEKENVNNNNIENEKNEEKKEEVVDNTNTNVNTNTNTNTNTNVNTNTNTTGRNESNISKRVDALTKLMNLLSYKKEDYTSDSYVDYESLINEINSVSNGSLNNLSNDQIDNYITKLEDAISKLVGLKLVDLTISSNNDIYKRLDAQKELTFNAVYNDETRTKEVNATSSDLFDTSLVAELKTMNYTYSDKYGNASSVYSYSVVKNDRDLLLDELNELLNTEINKDDYTTESVNNLEEAKNINADELTNEELESAIENIKEAINNLVKLELVGLEVTPNNTVYKRLDSQEKLSFKAIYNDETRNKENVEVTTQDTFNSESVIEAAKMTYTYSDNYGEASVDYNYSVELNRRDLLLNELEELLNKEIDEDKYTQESIDNLNETKDVNVEELTDDELEQLIEDIKEAINNLVEVVIDRLEVTPNNTVYKRLDSQEELTFNVYYNDETRNQKGVKATTEDKFDSENVTEVPSAMTYSYTDRYGTATVDYVYSVESNRRDLLLIDLNKLLAKEIDEDAYTRASVKALRDAENIDPEKLTDDELEAAIANIEEAFENLVLVVIDRLEVTPNNTVYKRLESQEELIFNVYYNDETRDQKGVKTTTEDVFSSEDVTEVPSVMTYSYTDRYGTATVDYSYTVEYNDTDLLLIELDRLKKLTIDEDIYTSQSVKVFKDAQKVDPSTLTTNEQIKAANKKIQDAYDALVLLVPTKLTISSNNDVYVRGDNQKKLVFNVTFNDETRNKENVNVTGTPAFDTNSIGDKTITYTYSSKYGNVSETYYYTVNKTERELLLEERERLLNLTIEERLYTSQSVKPFKDAQAEARRMNIDKATNEQIRKANKKIQDAYNALVKLKLTELKISSKGKTYKRLEEQEKLTFEAIYNDPTRNNKNINVTGTPEFDSKTNGSKKITYTYTDEFGTASVDYNYVVERNHEDQKIVSIVARLSKSEFGYKTTVNIKDYLKVYTVAKDGIETEISNYTYSGFSTNELTTNGTIKVKFSKFNTTASYSVVRTEEGQQLDKLEVKLDKTSYSWKSTNYIATVTATDNDGIKYTVTDYSVVTPFDTNTIGEKEFKVSYTKNNVTKEATVKYTVTRTNEGKVLDKIEAKLSDNTFKRETKEDVKSRLTVTAYDIDGTSYTLKSNEYKVTNFNVNNIGEYELTVSYTKSSVTKTNNVKYVVVYNDNDLKVKSVNVTLDKDNYSKNEEIEGLTVEVTYGHGGKEIVTTCSNDFDSSKAGYEKTLTVTCSGVKGTTNYSVYDNSLKSIKASLDRKDGRYSVDSAIYLTVNYIDEYNRTIKLSENAYEVSPALSTDKTGSFKSKVTYGSYEDEVSYTVYEEFLFDLRIVDNKYIEIKESYEDYIDISKIVVTYKDNDTSSYYENPGLFEDKITMVSYGSKTCSDTICTYMYPVYNTDNFDREGLFGFGSYKVPVKIEVYYGKAKTANSKYHSYKLNYSVTNNVVKFINYEDLKTEYKK